MYAEMGHSAMAETKKKLIEVNRGANITSLTILDRIQERNTRNMTSFSLLDRIQERAKEIIEDRTQHYQLNLYSLQHREDELHAPRGSKNKRPPHERNLVIAWRKFQIMGSIHS